MRIAPLTSLFLDGLRSVAAIGVMFAHLDNSRLVPGAGGLQPYGGFFVVAFFVLSGFVISATTNRQQSDGVRYFAARLARLWTVALPALLVAFLLQKVCEAISPSFIGNFDRGHSDLRYLLSATFSNELWFTSSGPPMILPVWSLAYEFWYYVIFGIAVYVRQRYVQIIGLLVIFGFVGPKILALLPVWLIGVGAWKTTRFRETLTQWVPWIVGGSVTLLTALIVKHPRWPDEIGYAPWFFSGAWISDSIFSLGIAGLIVGVDAGLYGCHVPRVWSVIIRRSAGVSFSLYLLHFPLMVSCAALLPYNSASYLSVALILCLILVIVYLFGVIFEPQRKKWTPRLELTMRVFVSHLPTWFAVCARTKSAEGGRPQAD